MSATKHSLQALSSRAWHAASVIIGVGVVAAPITACGDGEPTAVTRERGEETPLEEGQSELSAGDDGDADSSRDRNSGDDDSGDNDSAADDDAKASGGTPSVVAITDDSDDTLIVSAGSEDDGAALATECARDVYEGDPVAVNLYVLMDVSGSMRGPLSLETVEDAEGDTLWDAVSTAMEEFIRADESNGINMALSLYPVMSETSLCEEADRCTYFGGTLDQFQLQCIVGVCFVPFIGSGVVVGCQSNAACSTAEYADDCVIPGKCAAEPTRLCAFDSNCRDGDTCVPEEGSGTLNGICPGLASCEMADYETPLRAKSALPAAANELVELLDATKPDGLGTTPTHVALAGAYTHVVDWIADEPEANTVVVLVTDGRPNGCDNPENRNEICGAGSSCETSLALMSTASEDGVPTYVVGVVIEDDEETADIFKAMAAAGNTEQPFLVSADTTAAANFGAALGEIRGAVVPCEFGLPVPSSGVLDPDFVNVEVSEDGESEALPNVTSAADCGADSVGWYYVENADGALTGIELCEASCQKVSSSQTAQVDIVLGCPQVIKVR